MKVLVVSHGFPPRGFWGTEIYTHELVHALVARGHEVSVLHPVREGDRERYSVEEVMEDGVRVLLLENPGDRSKRFEPSYRDVRVEERFDEILERLAPDVVHFTYLLWGLSARLPVVARERGIPSILTLTDYGLVCHRGQMFHARLERCGGPHPPDVCARCIRQPGPFDAPLLPRLAKRGAAELLALFGGFDRVVTARDLAKRTECVADALAAVSLFVAPTSGLENAFRSAGVPEEKLVRSLYSFDESPYRPYRNQPGPDVPRFGFLAQFAPHKGMHTLVEAAEILHQRDPARPWELVLHGKAVAGRHRLYVERVLAERRESRVKLGPTFPPSEVARVLAGFSAIVLPSAWDENAPLSVLQARAIGVPVLGTQVPGIAEALPPEEAARLVPIGDAAALAARMEEVLDGRIARAPDPSLPQSLGEHADLVESLYARVRGTAAGGSGGRAAGA